MSVEDLQNRARQSQTIIDRVVSYFSPESGLKRIRSRLMMDAATGGYNSGRRSRRQTKNWRPGEGSADADILADLPDLRGRSRDMARNIPLAAGAISTNVTNVVGDGIQLQPSIDKDALNLSDKQADEWQRKAAREWWHFCNTLDFTRIQNFDELVALAFRSALESGDVFLIRRYRKDESDIYGTKVQLIEADRVSNPHRARDTQTLAGGVEFNGDGVPVAYHVSDKHPGALNPGSLKWTKVPARSADGKQIVIHLYDRIRPEQSRGVPYLAPVIELLKQLGDYSDAEVTAAVISAMYTVFIKSNADQDETPIMGEASSDLASNEIKLGAGAVVALAEGEDVAFANPSRPNEKFDPFVQAILRQIGVALELPFEVLIKSFTASYSASRAALEMAWQFWRRRRIWLSYRLCQVVYEWCIEEAVASGRLEAPGFFEDPIIRQSYCASEWIGPARMSLDPLKESKADELDVKMAFKTREQVCMERTGGEVEKKISQLGKEEALLREAGISSLPDSPAPSDNPADGENKDNEEENNGNNYE